MPVHKCGPSVAAVLLPTLSQTEQERFNEMPWELSSGDASVQINQTLLQTYCPQSYALVALVVNGEEWLNRDRVAHWVHRMGSSPETAFELPREFASMPSF